MNIICWHIHTDTIKENFPKDSVATKRTKTMTPITLLGKNLNIKYWEFTYERLRQHLATSNLSVIVVEACHRSSTVRSTSAHLRYQYLTTHYTLTLKYDWLEQQFDFIGKSCSTLQITITKWTKISLPKSRNFSCWPTNPTAHIENLNKEDRCILSA